MIVGRLRELEQLRQRVDALAVGDGSVVIISGDAGIGKTTLVDWVGEHTVGPLVRVSGHEADRGLASAGLDQLARSLEKLGIELSSEVRDVLDAATDPDRTPGPLAMGNVALTMLEELPAGSTVLVDDAHWLDVASAAALGFALRRLHGEPLLVVVAQRSDAESVVVSGGQRAQHLELQGLDAAAVAAILGEGTDDAVAERCAVVTNGNPLAVAEIGRMLDADQRAGRVPLPRDLPVAGRLLDAYVARIASLPDVTRQALAVVAAGADGPGDELVDALARAGLDMQSLEPAARAQLVSVGGGRVGIDHPLIRGAIREAVGPSRMREAYGTLAAVVPEPERRARLLAASTTGPDDAVAAVLDEAARAAARRGAPSVAAETWEQAAHLATDRRQRLRYRCRAGAAWWDANDARRATAATDLVLSTLDGDVAAKATAIGVRAEVTGWTSDSTAAAEMLAAAARDASTDDPARAAQMLMRASLHAGLAGRAETAFEHADRAMELLDDQDPLAVGGGAVRALSAQRLCRRELADADLESALLLADLPVADLAPALPALQALGLTLLAQERWGPAERVLTSAIQAARQHGLEGTLSFSSAVLGEVQLRRGRLADALAVASAYSFIDGADPAPTAPFAVAVTARIEATLGRFDEARRGATTSCATGERLGMNTLVAWACAALGRAALLADAPDEAVAHLRRAADAHREVADPGELWLEGDLGDALIATGDVGSARRVAQALRDAADRSGSRWARCTALRLDGIVESNADWLAEAIDLAGDIGAPLEHARALLAQAEVTGDGASAAEALRMFERAGASPWAGRARHLVDGTGRAAAMPEPSVTDTLTDAELRVAVAVAHGVSNRAAAEQLYISRRTVDAHLRRIYAKLGIASRSELTARVVRELG